MAVLVAQYPADPPWLERIRKKYSDYCMNNMPGGCCIDGWKKFCDFLLGSWDSKTIIELPGIGDVYAERLHRFLGPYCSVNQLYNMFRCWGVVDFRLFLHWVCQAELSPAGNSHIDRTVTAIEQKDRISHNLPVIIFDPNPNLLD